MDDHVYIVKLIKIKNAIDFINTNYVRSIYKTTTEKLLF